MQIINLISTIILFLINLMPCGLSIKIAQNLFYAKIVFLKQGQMVPVVSGISNGSVFANLNW